MATMTLDKIKFKTKEEKPCKTTLSVQIPPEVITEKQKRVSLDFQRAAQLPGFRAGKAPMDLVVRTFSDKIRNETLEQLLKEIVPHILKEKSLAPVTTPTIDQLEFEDNQPMSFHLLVEHSPEFKVKDYKNIPVQKKVKTFADADMAKELEQLQERNAQLVPSASEKVDKNHFVSIDYAGYIDGQIQQELIAENQLVSMEAPQTISGFAEGILGSAKGESKDVPITFPKEYPNKNLAGKLVSFKITIKDIKEKKVPALDDDFAKDFGLTSVQELKDKILESLKHVHERSIRADMEKQVYDYLAKENEIPLPESLVEYQLEALVDQTLQREFSAQDRKTQEDWDAVKKELRPKLQPQAERLVRLSYLIGGLAKQENLYATDAELDAEREKAEKANADKADQVRKYFEENRSKILNQLTEDKVLKYLIDHAKVKEVQDKQK